MRAISRWSYGSGSITSWKRQASHHITGQPGSIVKQVPYRPDSSLKQELSVKNLWPYKKMMASPLRSTPFCVLLKLLSWFAIQDQSKNVKLENNLCPCGELFADELRTLFPEGDDQGPFVVPTLDARSQILSVKDRRNGIGKLVFKLAPFEVDTHLPWCLLVCAFLVLLMKCCKGLSLKPARSGCDGRPFASPLFRRMAGRGALFRGFPFRWSLHIVLSVVHSIFTRAIRARCEDELLDVYIRPGNEAADFFFTAVWLQRSWSILIQDSQPARDLDSTCYNALIGEIATCSQMVPPFLECPMNLNGGRQRHTATWISSCGPTLQLETGRTSPTSNTAWRCTTGYIWLFPCRRTTLEHKRT